MSIRVALSHRTTYRYGHPVEFTPHVVRLRPAPHCRTPILSYSLTVKPKDHFLNWQQDPYGNHVARFVFPKKARELCFQVDLVADMTVINPFDFFLEEAVTRFPFEYGPTLKKELAPYLQCDIVEPALARLIAEVRRGEIQTIDYLVEINRVLNQRVEYVIRMEPGVQTPTVTLESGKGSCRDSAWLAVQLLRNLGLAARFVSGYLIQLTADQKSPDGPVGPEADFTDLHAWAEVFVPGAGWIGMDPTSGLLAGEGHIPLAASASPGSAAPITGSFLWTPPSAGTSLDQHFDFHMEVKRVQEVPRVTLPYQDQEWESILKLGQGVDEVLAEQDVRLTMGGEPTFISMDDMDGPEWNVTALGEEKKRLSYQLLCRLQGCFAEGSLLHFGQGKHYPGESLPRWAMRCLWREDGIPVWQNQSLLADPTEPGHSTTSDGEKFLKTLAMRLGVSQDFIRPAFEDRYYYLWREGGLPVNVETSDSRVSWQEEAERLKRVFSQGLEELVGHLLPLEFDTTSGRWRSGPWPLRAPEVLLIPGDSPMGYRLPLDSLPWVEERDQRQFEQRDPMDLPPPLPSHMSTISHLLPVPEEFKKPKVGVSAPEFVRTALCVEVREGRIHVFLPPLGRGEDFLKLLATIEKTAADCGSPVVLEGYPPPFDSRLLSFSITPDPGVIEVNVQPSGSWNELVEITETLYQEAREVRLGTEKFMLDGRHSGTGGGNHLVLGGKTPPDSPFLRRPDLLAQMVVYWLNHPGLSYLFSGLFIGPTSQAPRIDEARHDSLYELEIALQQKLDKDPPLWIVDRLFRHLLTDMTGNTHRAEFCIDKLYSPEGPTGRLGLLELRAFEMPPHPRMSLVQQLLVRALVAHLWTRPYGVRPVRWGTRLHDEFMLGHFVWKDFLEVLDDLRRGGFDFQPAWFAPHFEFRFPRIGEIQKDGLILELRNAIEPWHVLGEESGGGGTVRFVDSSLERIQVKLRGMNPDRHVLLCNGRPVPLHPTGVAGEAVAGVRFRAWQPPSCLHPTIGTQVPLIFDLVDTWSERSLGGCTYGVSHPGGRNYEHFPVNSNEAQARRTARFSELKFTGGRIEVPKEATSAEFPLTLDLRRAP
ncbi:MAG: transglutaminase family protein [Vulcanimicrobiota bacterium]